MTAVATPAAAAPAAAVEKLHRLRLRWIVAALLIAQGIVGLVGLLASLGSSGELKEAPAAPIAQRSGLQTQASAAGGTISTSTFSLLPPAGWRVLKQSSTSISLLGPNAEGSLYVVSGKLSAPTTLVQAANQYLQGVGEDAPDAHVCVKASRERLPGGPSGVLVGVCQTVTPASGRAFEGIDLIALGLNARGDVLYVLDFFTVAKDAELKRFLTDAKPLVSTLQWKLR